MPADVNKTVAINVKADLADLLANLKKMPGMTSAEAKKMVGELSKQLKKAESAAKKAAATNKKAMRSIQMDAKRATTQMKALKRNAGQVGGSLRAMGDAASYMSPEFAAAADGIATAGMAFQGLGRMVVSGNPYLLAAVGIAGTLGAAYMAFKHVTGGVERAQDALQKVTKEVNATLAEQEKRAKAARDALSSNAAKVNQISAEYLLLTGVLTDYEHKSLMIEKQAGDMQHMLEENAAIETDAREKSILGLQRQIESQEQVIQAMIDAGEAMEMQGDKGLQASAAFLEETDKLQSMQTNLKRKQDDLTAAQERNTMQIQSQVSQFQNLKQGMLDIEREREQQEAAAEARAKAESERAQQKAEQEKENAKIEAELEAEKQRLSALTVQIKTRGEAAAQSALNASIQARNAEISMMDLQSERLLANFEMQNEHTARRIAALMQEKQITDSLAETEEQIAAAKQANAEIDSEIADIQHAQLIEQIRLTEELAEARKQETLARMKEGTEIAGFYVKSAHAAAALIDTASNKNKKAAIVSFRISQAASLAEIAMTTAEKIMEVSPNPLAMAGIGTLGALQAATVIAQSPPEAHMGGFITKGEDTRDITVLSGEAVLNRRTVNRLGGEEGINKLQRGGSMRPEVIVTNPFKHFDRYAHASMTRGGALSRIARKKATGRY